MNYDVWRVKFKVLPVKGLCQVGIKKGFIWGESVLGLCTKGAEGGQLVDELTWNTLTSEDIS